MLSSAKATVRVHMGGALSHKWGENLESFGVRCRNASGIPAGEQPNLRPHDRPRTVAQVGHGGDGVGKQDWEAKVADPPVSIALV